MVGGAAELPSTQTPGQLPPNGIDVAMIILDQSRMRGITGAGEELTIIPSMDTSSPVDIEPLAATVPPECRFAYAETAIFGSAMIQFHKTTFQYPPKGALISEGAAAYPDEDAARGAFNALVAMVTDCADNSAGPMMAAEWGADADSLRIRAGRCGSDYRITSAVLLEVTFYGFPESVSGLVITNLAAAVPG
ncbi:MAG: sensor domain-containing protein [Mycobacterium sp.]